MSGPTNSDRAAYARKAIKAVPEKYDEFDVDLPNTISDLIADLLHLAHLNNIDVAGVIGTAEMNFEAEINEEY